LAQRRLLAKHNRRPSLLPVNHFNAAARATYLSSLPHRAQRAAPHLNQSATVAGQILVLVAEDEPASIGDTLGRTYGLQHVSSRPIALLSSRAVLLHIREGQSEEAILRTLLQDPRVRSAQLNRRYFHSDMQGKGYRHTGEENKRLDLKDAAALPQYGPLKLSLPEAHQLALGRNVRVAVIDSSVDTTHPDLKDAVTRSFNAAGGADATPDFHGTAVAGIIRAHGLVEGAAPEADVMAVRAFRASGPSALPETTTDVLLTAIDWAVTNGAKVLNMSFVGAHDPALQQLLEAVSQKGIIAVAAAGNGGPDGPAAYPAAYPGVIAVTAVNEADDRYAFANRGSYIAVSAPGVDILAPVERGGHAYVSGTSFAAAYVSGIAALLLEREPRLNATSVTDLIIRGADDVGPVGRDDDFGAGRANAYRSIKLLLGNGLAQKQDPGVKTAE
jgi:subtilisin family serine protease